MLINRISLSLKTRTVMKVNWMIMMLAVVILLACSSNDVEPKNKDDDDDTDEPAGPQKLTTDPAKTFVHPGLLHSQADLDRIKAKVDAEAEPWISGWQKLTANVHASSTYTPNPVVKLVRGGGSREEPDPDNYGAAFNDAAAAYQLAIRWKVTGDVAYANAAIRILNAWAATCTSISGDSNKALGAGLYGYQFANAAELMRDYEGWAEADFAAFKKWLMDVFYPVSHAFLSTHWNTCISHYWANWDLCNIASIMAIGVLNDDAALYNEAIDYLMNGQGNGNLDKAIYYVHADGTGQLQESGRDQGHTLLCVGLMGTIAQMAWNQGDDLYGYDDNRILKAAEYAAKYNHALLDVSFEPYNNCDNVNHTVVSDNGKGGKRPIWERIYHHYAKRKGLEAPYTEIAARVNRVEGGGGDYGSTSGGFDDLGFGTLLYTQE